MYIKGKRCAGCLLIMFLAVICVGCGSYQVDDTPRMPETESEKEIEVLDAKDILVTVWNEYEPSDTDGNPNNNRFEVMGGHFDSCNIGEPEKYDLTKTYDLVQMYCVQEGNVLELDDVATMVDLYNASKFTASAIHVTDASKVSGIIEGIRTQVISNQWHSDKPEKLVIIQVKDQYVVSVFGDNSLVSEFQEILEEIYRKAAKVVVEEKLPLE